MVGDSPELITAAATLGVAHPPGYPLFTMLAHLFSTVPFGLIPFRVNLFSVTCDSICLAVIYLISFRLTQCSLCSAAASLLLGLNPIFWSWSLTAEVFPLNNLITALLLYLVISWDQHPERSRYLIGGSFVAGLGLTNHHTIVLLFPAVGFAVWRQRHQLRLRLVGVCLAVFCIGLLPYAYIPWASAHHPPYNWGGVSSLRDLIGLISRSDYGAGSLVGDPRYRGGSALRRLIALFLSFGWAMGPLLIVGAYQAYRSARWYFWFSAIAFVFAGPFFVLISNLNLDAAPRALSVLERFFLLPQVALSPLLAFGVLFIIKHIAQLNVAFARLSSWLVAAVLLSISVALISINYRPIDQSHNSIARHFAADAFSSTEPGSILLVAGDAIAFPLIYLQTVEHVRAEVPLIGTRFLSASWYLGQLRERYPGLVIPFAEYDPEEHNLQMLLDANASRPAFAIGPATGDDHSLDQTYLTYPHGLLVMLAPRSKTFSAEDILARNIELLGQYHVPSFTTVRTNTLEADILATYAWPEFRIGQAYERRSSYPEARTWYQRALAIDPSLPQAREGLRRVSPDEAH